MVSGARLTVKIGGIGGFITRLTNLETAASRQAREAVRAAAELVMSRSIPQVPVDTGALRDSNYIEDVASDKREARVTFGYGGPNIQTNPKTGKPTTDYYLYVHERLDLHHPHGNAKFFEKPLIESLDELEETVGAKLLQVF